MTEKHPENVEINTHGVAMPFGKFTGERVTRVPVSYLTWAISNRIERPTMTRSGVFPFWKVAKAELERRGERIQEMEVSAHAIDRLSLRFWHIYKEHHKDDEGLFSWAQRVALEAWQEREFHKKDGNAYTIKYMGIEWVIEEMAVPVVKTVK